MATVRGRNVMKKKQYTTLASPPNLKLNDSLSKDKKIVNKKKKNTDNNFTFDLGAYVFRLRAFYLQNKRRSKF